MKPKKILPLIMTLIVSFSSWADEVQQTLTVEQAYSAIPHQQTRFDVASSPVDNEEKQFLDLFFGLTDLALVERITLLKLDSQNQPVEDNYDDILRRLTELQVPERIVHAHQLVIEAVREQKTYLELWRSGKAGFNINDPLVESSHGKLTQAYGELMRAYPQENAHNKQAFFDHLCALDFK